MSHEGSSEHVQSSETARDTLFPPAEVAGLHAEDKHAATAIVCLMVSIFTMGLCLYAAIALWVGSSTAMPIAQ
jgi:hypothetical protein